MEGLKRENFYSEKYIKNLFDSIPIPSYVWQKRDNDFILIDFNKAAKNATQEKAEKLLYEKASISYKDRPDIIGTLNECFNQKKSISLQTKYTVKTTGEEVYLSIRNYYIPPNLVVVHVKDLTKRKLAENQLLESEQKYKMLFENSPIPIVLLSLKGKILDVNHATEKIFGYDKEELINKNYLSLCFYPSNNLPLFKSRLSNLNQGKSVEPTEFQIFKKDGEKVWIYTEVSLIRINDESLIQAFIFNITERKNFEQKIERMLRIEQLISTISSRFIGSDNIDDSINNSLIEMGSLIQAERAYILLYNEEDTLEFYTQEWCLKGIAPQKINPIVIQPNNFPWAQEQYMKNGYIYIANKLNLPESADNIKQVLNDLNIDSLLLFPIIIKGELYGFIGFDNLKKFQEWHKEEIDLFRTSSEVIGNALERKWSEETLKGSHQLLAGIISSLTESICLIDFNFNIIWTNNVSNQLFGQHLVNKKCYKIFFQRGKPCENCIGFKTFTDGRIHEKEVELKNLDGEQIICWYTSSSAGLNIEGETEFAVLFFRDITKRKTIEESLIKSEQSLRQLNEFLKEKIEERTKELKQSEDNYKRILNDLDVGFYKGQFKGELLMHNSKLNEILGLDASISLLGLQAVKFFVDDITQENYYSILTRSDYVKDFEAKIRRPDGTIIKVNLNSHLIRDNDGNPKEVEGTVILIE